MRFENAHDAMRHGQGRAPCAIGWNRREAVWQPYSVTAGCPDGIEPELLCLGPGKLPLALSECGAQILAQLVRASASYRVGARL